MSIEDVLRICLIIAHAGPNHAQTDDPQAIQLFGVARCGNHCFIDCHLVGRWLFWFGSSRILFDFRRRGLTSTAGTFVYLIHTTIVFISNCENEIISNEKNANSVQPLNLFSNTQTFTLSKIVARWHLTRCEIVSTVSGIFTTPQF